MRADHEIRFLKTGLGRTLLRLYRHHIWMRDPLHKNHLLDQFLERVGEPDLVIANGDYTVDTTFVGVCDPAAETSVHLCLTRLRDRFGSRLRVVMGDHELGKKSMIGNAGGLRYESLQTATETLNIPAFWTMECGVYLFVAVTSSLLAFPLLESEALPEERQLWYSARQRHIDEIERLFENLRPGQRVALFCHDPSALPYLSAVRAVNQRLSQIEFTMIGHLHSPFVFRVSQILAGMPQLRWFGPTISRLSGALSRAAAWRPFRVKLCPSVAGIEILKDGGFLRLKLDETGQTKPKFTFVSIPR